MSDLSKFLIMCLCMTPVAGFLMYSDYTRATNFEAEGKVVEARWNTKNHQMSLFKIQNGNITKQLHHARVLLTQSQIKVGDTFKKVKGSNMCLINGTSIQCVR